MAKIGLAYLGFAPITEEPTDALPSYGAGLKLGHAIKADLSITNASGQLYGDNILVEDVNEFSSGTVAAETDNIPLATQAALFGATLVDGELGYGSDDTQPIGGLCYYQVLLIGGTKKFRAFYYPKAKAVMGDDTAATKSNSITFGTYPLNFTIFAPEWGKWRYVKDFDEKEDAIAYIEDKLNIASWYRFNVQMQGAGDGETVSPLGEFMVAGDDDKEIVITGTPTALYDNGTDKVASIAGGKYTISDVDEGHTISVIF